MSYKWVQRWAGPYKVIKVLRKDVYLIDIPKKGRFHYVFHVSVLKKFTPNKDELHPEQVLRPEPSYKIWDKKMGQVNGIVGKKRLKQGLVYQCTFEGFLMMEYQWISASYLKHVKSLIAAYEVKMCGTNNEKRDIKRKTPK